LLHDGHHNSPAASLRSTPSRSASTVTTAPPSATRRPSRSSGQRDNGRAVAYQRPDHRAAPTPQTATGTDRPRPAAQPQRRTATPTWSPWMPPNKQHPSVVRCLDLWSRPPPL